MSVSWPGSMRGPQLKTPRLLLLLLLLLSTLTATVLCQDEEPDVGAEEDNPVEEPETEPEPEPEPEPDPEANEYSDVGPLGNDVTQTSETPPADPEPTGPEGAPDDGTTDNEGSGDETTADPNLVSPSATPPGEEEGLSPIIILIPVVLVVLIIAMIVCGIFINRRWNQNARNQELRKEDPYLDGTSTEKVPMPMFEEDVPSVLELEMEELDQWMKKDGETAEDSKVP